MRSAPSQPRGFEGLFFCTSAKVDRKEGDYKLRKYSLGEGMGMLRETLSLL
jgi:hypothetical protein